MSPVVRWGVTIGAAIALVDLVALLLTQGAEGQAELWLTLDQVANWALLAFLGYRVGAELRAVRPAAEAAVLAGAIAGVAAALAGLTFGLEGASETANIVGVIAYNVAQAGVIGLVAGWLGSRAEARQR